MLGHARPMYRKAEILTFKNIKNMDDDTRREATNEARNESQRETERERAKSAERGSENAKDTLRPQNQRADRNK